MENGEVEIPKEKKKNPNSVWVKGCPSPNPAGRPKGVPSVSADVKESIIKTFYSAGGSERILRIMNAPTKKADAIFLSFLKNIVIPLLPKKTEYDIEHRSVTFVFGDRPQEKFESSETIEDGDVINISNEEEREEEK
jgi:hypothetical protein